MKRFLIGFIFLVSFFPVSSSFTTHDNLLLAEPNNVTVNSVACRFGQCKAIAKSTGNRCKHCVSNSGDSYCWQHR